MKLIIFTGPPASGKSSLANNLGKKLHIDVISKDEFKIRLFEKYGFRNHDEKKKLSLLGEQQLFESIKRHVDVGCDVIVDNNFKTFDVVRAIIKKRDVDLFCIDVYADYEILARRYNDRIARGNRHTALFTLNQYPVVDGVSIFHKPIDKYDVERIQQNVVEKTLGENVLRVNTDNIENDFDEIYFSVESFVLRKIL